MTPLPVGKLPIQLLRTLLARYVTADPRVVVGPQVGFDATIIDMADRYLVAKTDPVTFATDEVGWYSVHVNANDVACCGAEPRWYLATLLLPEAATTPQLVESLFGQISAACSEVGATLCGGHTEITYGLDRPIVVGQMLGEVPRDRYVTTSGAQVGDVLILTKALAIEGTAVIARERSGLLRGIFSAAELDRCAAALHDPGISVVPEARLALDVGGVHALHDPTEGGIATGLAELAEAAGVGVLVEQARLPILPECGRICRQLGLDPLGLIASGSLLIAADPDRSMSIVARLGGAGIDATEIGRVISREHGCRLRRPDGLVQPLPIFARDEITRLFG